MKHAQTPINLPAENISLALTPDEYDFLLRLLGDSSYAGKHIPTAIYNKIRFLTSGGACLRPAQPSEALGQGGSNFLGKYSNYSDEDLQYELEFLSYENGRVARGHASQVLDCLTEARAEKERRKSLKALGQGGSNEQSIGSFSRPVELSEAFEQNGIKNSVIWKRLRFPGCEMWECGNILVRREYETYGYWVVVFFGNPSVHVWKTARAAKKAAESITKPIVIKSHIPDVGYEEVFPFCHSSQGGSHE